MAFRWPQRANRACWTEGSATSHRQPGMHQGQNPLQSQCKANYENWPFDFLTRKRSRVLGTLSGGWDPDTFCWWARHEVKGLKRHSEGESLQEPGDDIKVLWRYSDHKTKQSRDWKANCFWWSDQGKWWKLSFQSLRHSFPGFILSGLSRSYRGCLSTWTRADPHTENLLKLAHFLRLRKFGAWNLLSIPPSFLSSADLINIPPLSLSKSCKCFIEHAKDK